MKHSFDIKKAREEKMLVEYINLTVYGQYEAVSSGKRVETIQKTLTGQKCGFGENAMETGIFDKIGGRKSAYKTTNTIILSHLIGTNHRQKTVVDYEPVKIFNI